MNVLVVRTKEGLAGFHPQDIGSILPDLGNPKSHSVIYSSIHPNGITVEEESATLVCLWEDALVGVAHEDEEDEDA